MPSTVTPTGIQTLHAGLQGALVEVLVGAVGPELLLRATTEVVERMLADILRIGAYGGLGDVVTKRIHVEIAKQLDLPEIAQRMRTAVREGIDQACASATEQVKGKILDHTFKAMNEALERMKCGR